MHARGDRCPVDADVDTGVVTVVKSVFDVEVKLLEHPVRTSTAQLDKVKSLTLLSLDLRIPSQCALLGYIDALEGIDEPVPYLVIFFESLQFSRYRSVRALRQQ